MRLTEKKRHYGLALSLGALALTIIAGTMVLWVNIDRIELTAHEDDQTRGVLAWADVAADAIDQQADALVSLAKTHDVRFVAPYRDGQEHLSHALEMLRASTTGGLEERHALDQAAAAVQQWRLTVAYPTNAALQAGHSPLITPDIRLGQLANVKGMLDRFRIAEIAGRDQRDQSLQGADKASREVLALGSVFCLVFSTLIFVRTAGHLVNDRRRAEAVAESLKQALEDVQAAEQTKVRFLTNMSHEMRTPLNGVAGLTEALRHTNLDASQREMLEAIRFSSTTLDQLIGDLLDVSRSSEAHPVQREAAFNLLAAIRVTAEPFAAAAENKGLKFEIDPPAGIVGDVIGHPAALGQLLCCLLSNAVKFTDRGEVRMRVRRESDETYTFEVADTGVGFNETRKLELFEAFGQSDDSDTRRGGAGIGLALARRLAEDLGGALDAHSVPGHGSVFFFQTRLPAAKMIEHAVVQPVPSKVMIVDDNATNRKVLEVVLDQVGVAWVSVENGQQAVEAAQEHAFAAILMDIQMPVMDGLTATREIRRLEREAGRTPAPVIIVSANCQPQQIAAGVVAGAQRHLAKPVNVGALLEALDEVMPTP